MNKITTLYYAIMNESNTHVFSVHMFHVHYYTGTKNDAERR